MQWFAQAQIALLIIAMLPADAHHISGIFLSNGNSSNQIGSGHGVSDKSKAETTKKRDKQNRRTSSRYCLHQQRYLLTIGEYSQSYAYFIWQQNRF